MAASGRIHPLSPALSPPSGEREEERECYESKIAIEAIL
jgi:hypothetical protein